VIAKQSPENMFTGLVEALGVLVGVEARPPGLRLWIEAGPLADDAALGDSIALNGCCLTVVEREGHRLAFDYGPETLSRTNLGRLTTASRVNLERSLKLGDRLGGHLVTGHVDALGALERRTDDADWSTMWFSVPDRLTRQMAAKGSIAVDGVGLTLVEVEADRFSVALIPHTLAVTTLGALKAGDPVNLETDLLAKYVESQLKASSPRV